MHQISVNILSTDAMRDVCAAAGIPFHVLAPSPGPDQQKAKVKAKAIGAANHAPIALFEPTPVPATEDEMIGRRWRAMLALEALKKAQRQAEADERNAMPDAPALFDPRVHGAAQWVRVLPEHRSQWWIDAQYRHDPALRTKHSRPYRRSTRGWRRPAFLLAGTPICGIRW